MKKGLWMFSKALRHSTPFGALAHAPNKGCTSIRLPPTSSFNFAQLAATGHAGSAGRTRDRRGRAFTVFDPANANPRPRASNGRPRAVLISFLRFTLRPPLQDQAREFPSDLSRTQRRWDERDRYEGERRNRNACRKLRLPSSVIDIVANKTFSAQVALQKRSPSPSCPRNPTAQTLRLIQHGALCSRHISVLGFRLPAECARRRESPIKTKNAELHP